jgi:hypothetical protein
VRSFAFAALLIASFTLAACGGTNTGPPPFVPTAAPTAPPTSTPTGTVSFLFLVPSTSGSAARHRNIVLPSNAQSVTITIDSVNGVAYTGPPTTVNLSTSNTNCQQTSTQLSCVANVTAPAGTLVYTIAVFSGTNGGGTQIGAGNLSVTLAANGTVTAPLTLSGTVAKLVVSISGAAELGNASSVPVTVQAEDANGDTILGTYSSAVTLTDTDASGQTSLSATNIASSTAGTGITLNYLGGAMASPATIGASAGSIIASNVSFQPDATRPLVSGNSVTFDTSVSDVADYNVTSPAPSPVATTGTITVTYATAQPFAGVSNAVAVTSTNSNGGEVTSETDYYAWTQNGSTLDLSSLGNTLEVGPYTIPETCAAPYAILLEIPLPSAGWDGLTGAGACTTDFSIGTDLSYDYVQNSDGSYTASIGLNGDETSTGTLSSSGAGTYIQNSTSGGDSYVMSLPAVTSNAATVSVALSEYPSTSLPSPLPSPSPTTAPNPWLLLPASLNGVQPAKLTDHTYTDGTVAASALPASCAIGSGIIPSGASLTHVQDQLYIADPLMTADSLLGNEVLYETGTTDTYYLNGVGAVCIVYNDTYYTYDESSLEYYDGSDVNVDEATNQETDSLQSTDLSAQLKQSRSMTQAVSRASALFTIASQAHHNVILQAQHAAVRKHQLLRVNPGRP